MKTVSLSVGLTALALAFGVASIEAEAQSLERKKNFIENLFSPKKARKTTVQKKVVWKKKKKKKSICDSWLNEDES